MFASNHSSNNLLSSAAGILLPFDLIRALWLRSFFVSVNWIIHDFEVFNTKIFFSHHSLIKSNKFWHNFISFINAYVVFVFRRWTCFNLRENSSYSLHFFKLFLQASVFSQLLCFFYNFCFFHLLHKVTWMFFFLFGCSLGPDGWGIGDINSIDMSASAALGILLVDDFWLSMMIWHFLLLPDRFWLMSTSFCRIWISLLFGEKICSSKYILR